MTACDSPDCLAVAMFRLYAAYNADNGENVHPLHARYPGAMMRTCALHVGTMMLTDTGFGRTGQWLVIVMPS